jgi:hypothetical protein
MNNCISRKLWSLVILLTSSTILFGQSQQFRIGLKAQGNLSWLTTVSKNLTNEGVGFGYSYGIMGDYNFARFYALSAELLLTEFSTSMSHNDSLSYTQNGNTTNYGGVKHDYQYRYLQLPVSLKFKTKEIGYITYWAQFGLAPSFLLRARADIRGSNPFEANDPTRILVNKTEGDDFEFDNFNDKVSFIRVPLIIGAGIEYSLAGNTSLYTGVRIENSFTNVFPADDRTDAKNNMFSLAAGFFF